MNKLRRVFGTRHVAGPAGSRHGTVGGLPAEATRQGYTLRVEEKHFDEICVHLGGRIFMENADAVRKDLLGIIEREPMKNLQIDLKGVDYIDSSGVAILVSVNRTSESLNNRLSVTNVPKRFQGILGLFTMPAPVPSGILSPLSAPNVLVQIGEGCSATYRNVLGMLSFIGEAAEALVHDVSRPRQLLRL